MISFDEYNLLESYIGSENFEILLEKNLTSEIDKNIPSFLPSFLRVSLIGCLKFDLLFIN